MKTSKIRDVSMNGFYLKIVCVVVMCFATIDVNSQSFEIVSKDYVPKEGDNINNTERPKSTDYPYLDVAIYFCPNNLLNKKFLGYFNKLKYFYFSVTPTEQNKELATLPLFLYEKKGNETTRNEEADGIYIIEKYRVSVYDKISDNIRFDIKIIDKRKNQAIDIVKQITDEISPIIKNPSSVYGFGAAEKGFDFLKSVVGQLNSEQTSTYKIGFSLMLPEKQNSKHYSYDVKILKRSNDKNIINRDNMKFYIKDNKLYVDSIPYTAYPYFIIQKSLSNYWGGGSDNKLPSELSDCNITEIEKKQLEKSLDNLKDRLSSQQYTAEKRIYNYVETLFLIKEGISELNKTKKSEDIMRKTYIALYNYKTKDTVMVDSQLYSEHYLSIEKLLVDCIESNIVKLPLFNTLSPLFKTLNKDFSNPTNEDLRRVYNYLEDAKKEQFIYIRNSALFEKSEKWLNDAEREIYQTKFENIVNTINAADNIDGNIQTQKSELVTLENNYTRCKLCIEKATQANSVYNKLINQQEEIRSSMSKDIEQATSVYEKGLAILGNVNSILKQDSTISTPFNINDFDEILKQLKNDKETLNNKTALSFFSKREKEDITMLEKDCNRKIQSIEDMIKKLEPFIEKNNVFEMKSVTSQITE
ncbi:MAG: hypothetical protein LBN95_13105 [Prevotellaceae bacterium]|nr:hypothetical protein [Prevotellaceae bacterium]